MIGGFLFRGFLWVSGTHVDRIDDGDTGGELVQIGAADKTGDESIDGERAQRERTEQNHARMGAGWILAQVGKFDIMRCSFLAAHAISVSGREGKLSSAAVRTSCPNPVNTGFK